MSLSGLRTKLKPLVKSDGLQRSADVAQAARKRATLTGLRRVSSIPALSFDAQLTRLSFFLLLTVCRGSVRRSGIAHSTRVSSLPRSSRLRQFVGTKQPTDCLARLSTCSVVYRNFLALRFHCSQYLPPFLSPLPHFFLQSSSFVPALYPYSLCT
jgi:hypothetical protein